MFYSLCGYIYFLVMTKVTNIQKNALGAEFLQNLKKSNNVVSFRPFLFFSSGQF